MTNRTHTSYISCGRVPWDNNIKIHDCFLFRDNSFSSRYDARVHYLSQCKKIIERFCRKSRVAIGHFLQLFLNTMHRINVCGIILRSATNTTSFVSGRHAQLNYKTNRCISWRRICFRKRFRKRILKNVLENASLKTFPRYQIYRSPPLPTTFPRKRFLKAFHRKRFLENVFPSEKRWHLSADN